MASETDPDPTGGMSSLSSASSGATDQDLQAVEARLMDRTQLELARLRPSMDPEELATYEALVQAVRRTAAANESLADLRGRIQALGQGAVQLATRLSTLAP